MNQSNTTALRAGTLVICLFVFCSTLRAQDQGFGIGLVAGDPTGISSKVWTTRQHALQFSLAWWNGNRFPGSRVSLSGDLLWHSFDAIRSTSRLPVFYGVGAILTSGGGMTNELGLHGVVGIAWFSREIPIDLFLQVTPTLLLAPGTAVGFGAGLGLRFYIR